MLYALYACFTVPMMRVVCDIWYVLGILCAFSVVLFCVLYVLYAASTVRCVCAVCAVCVMSVF